MDYSYTAKNIQIKAAAYYKTETGKQTINSYISIDNLETLGFEIYTALRLSKNFKLTASNLFIDQKMNSNNTQFNGNYDFNYLLKLSLQFIKFKWFTASISYIARPGRHYTAIKEAIQIPAFPHIIPIFDKNINSSQYADYQKLDFTINRYTPIGKYALIPFLSITNILNTKNTGGYYYNHDYTQKNAELYGKRVIYFGIIFQM